MRPFRVSRLVVPATVCAVIGGLTGASGQAAAGVAACTPTVTSVSGQTVVAFTAVGVCSWSMPTGASHISALVVGGGGSGGRSDERSVGGGGGGGVAVGTELALSGSFLITVGAGGTNTQGCGPWPETSNGGASSISNADLVPSGSEIEIIADGGARGAGCSENTTAASGGSGGGGHSDWVPNGGAATKGSFVNITGVTLYGNAGGAGNATSGLSGGGGGGASAAGSAGAAGAGGDGGEGVSNDITGTLVVYGSGGGAIGTVSDGDGGTNAGDGLPAALIGAASSVADAVPNTGGGGGGAFEATSGSGGSGIVVIRYTPAPGLPPTGSASNTSMLVLGAGLVVMGGVLTAVRRRRTV